MLNFCLSIYKISSYIKGWANNCQKKKKKRCEGRQEGESGIFSEEWGEEEEG